VHPQRLIFVKRLSVFVDPCLMHVKTIATTTVNATTALATASQGIPELHARMCVQMNALIRVIAKKVHAYASPDSWVLIAVSRGAVTDTERATIRVNVFVMLVGVVMIVPSC